VRTPPGEGVFAAATQDAPQGRRGRAEAPGLNARPLGKPYSLVGVARPEVFRHKTGELAGLDALAAEVEPLSIQRVDYQDLERMGQLPRARRWVLTGTQAGSVTLAEAWLGTGRSGTCQDPTTNLASRRDRFATAFCREPSWPSGHTPRTRRGEGRPSRDTSGSGTRCLRFWKDSSSHR
jgi:hypothetical protein